MVFNLKRVFVAMICAVFILGFFMASTVHAHDPDQDSEVMQNISPNDQTITITFNLAQGTYVIDPPYPSIPKAARHKHHPRQNPSPAFPGKQVFGLYKCKKKGEDVACDFVYYIPCGQDCVYEFKGLDPNCIP